MADEFRNLRRFLFQVMDERRWTETKLATQAGIARSVVSAHLAGKRAIRGRHVQRYLAVLGDQQRAELLKNWLVYHVGDVTNAIGRIVRDASPFLIWASGPDKLCTFFNKAWLEFTGCTMEESLGNGWLKGVHPRDRARCMKAYSKAFDARKVFIIKYRLKRFDGTYHVISDHGAPRNGNGKFLGYAGGAILVEQAVRSIGRGQRHPARGKSGRVDSKRARARQLEFRA